MPTSWYYNALTGRVENMTETVPSIEFRCLPSTFFATPETLKIRKVIFNDPATIVFWSDGTKTIVKCSKDDTFDKEKGLAMAVCKKLLGHNHNLRKLKKWLKV